MFLIDFKEVTVLAVFRSMDKNKEIDLDNINTDKDKDNVKIEHEKSKDNDLVSELIDYIDDVGRESKLSRLSIM